MAGDLISPKANAAIGAIGSACILLAYLLLTFQSVVLRLTKLQFTSDTVAYHALNLVGGALAGASAFITEDVGAIPLGILETVWAVIAIGGLLQIAWRWRSGPPPSEAAPPPAELLPAEVLRSEPGSSASASASDTMRAEAVAVGDAAEKAGTAGGGSGGGAASHAS